MPECNGLTNEVKDTDIVEAVFYCPKISETSRDMAGGYFVIAKPLGSFDGHSGGEGGNQEFVRVRCKAGWLRAQNWEADEEVTEEEWVYSWLEDGEPTEVSETLVREKAGVRGYHTWDATTACDVWKPIPDGVVPVRRFVKKREKVHHMRIIPPGVTANNLIKQSAVALTEVVSEKEYTSLIMRHDTGENAILTVGLGMTYATISAAIIAASSGDIIEVYDTTNHRYDEGLNNGTKWLQIIGLYGNAINGTGLEVRSLGYFGHTLSIDGNAVHCQNLYFTTASDGDGCCAVFSSANSVPSEFRNCRFRGLGATNGNGILFGCCKLINCQADNNRQSGFYGWNYTPSFAVNCVAAKNGAWGFRRNGSILPVLCISVGNSIEDFRSGECGANGSALNTSADASAQGAGAVTGFLPTDFVDYANNDFRLRAAVMNTTRARFLGYPNYPHDAWGQTRKTTGVTFAGLHDPDPAGSPPVFFGVTSVVDNGDGSVTVTWGAATGEDHFRIYLKNGAAPANNDIAGIALADATSCRIKYKQGVALTAGGDWYARVNAINSIGISDGNTATQHVILTDTTAGALAVTAASYAPVQLGTTVTTIYTCPPGAAKARVLIVFCNTNAASRTIQYGIVRVGDAYADDVLSVKNLSLDAAGGVRHTHVSEVYTLQQGDRIQGLASAAAAVTCTQIEVVRWA